MRVGIHPVEFRDLIQVPGGKSRISFIKPSDITSVKHGQHLEPLLHSIRPDLTPPFSNPHVRNLDSQNMYKGENIMVAKGSKTATKQSEAETHMMSGQCLVHARAEEKQGVRL